jgi:hypothetical protein
MSVTNAFVQMRASSSSSTGWMLHQVIRRISMNQLCSWSHPLTCLPDKGAAPRCVSAAIWVQVMLLIQQ